jgi:hypothetical protein
MTINRLHVIGLLFLLTTGCKCPNVSRAGCPYDAEKALADIGLGDTTAVQPLVWKQERRKPLGVWVVTDSLVSIAKREDHYVLAYAERESDDTPPLWHPMPETIILDLDGVLEPRPVLAIREFPSYPSKEDIAQFLKDVSWHTRHEGTTTLSEGRREDD